MMRKLRYFVPICLTAVFALGCNRDVTPEAELNITFDVRLAGENAVPKAMTRVAAKTGQFTEENLSSLDQFGVTGYDGSDRIIDGRTVHKIDGAWLLDDNPRAWLSGHTMTFWADANMPSWVESVSSTTKDEATMTLTSDGIPTSAASQGDPLIGYYTGTGDNGKATIMFYHPMTAVKFVTGELGEPQKIASISGISLEGVHKSGSATITGGSPITVEWTPSGSTTTVSGNFLDGASEEPFILIPQEIESDEVTVKVYVNLQEGGISEMFAIMSADEWKAGYIYTYQLDYVPISSISSFTVTLIDWSKLMSKDGDEYFDVNFGNKPPEES